MAEKENQKKNWSIEAFQVMVCREKKLAPFLNIFDFEGLTPEQKKVGRLFGAIQIFDYDEKSAYLPNLVAQVIKKEFFKENKRSGEESFEIALRKANLALADLASHEIVGWIGKFHAVIGAIQGNDFWFTQSGGGKIILVRKKIANEISLGLDSEESSSHPVKTFSNISSGKLEDEDKIIFASEGVFEKNRWEEFSRHITVFSSSELDNLLRSTIELEAENAGFVLVNVQTNSAPVLSQNFSEEPPAQPDLNFFGKKDQLAAEKIKPEIPAPEKKEPPEEKDADSSPFEQEPELYIKENEKEAPTEETEPVTEPVSIGETHPEEITPRQPFPWKEKLSFWKHPKIQNGLANMQNISQKSFQRIDSMKQNLDFSSSKEKISRFFQKEETTPIAAIEENTSEETMLKEKTPSVWLIRWQNFKKKYLLSRKFWLTLIALVFIFLLIKIFLERKQPVYESTDDSSSVNAETDQNTDQAAEVALKELAQLPEKVLYSTFLKKKIYLATENGSFYQLDQLDQKEASVQKIDLPKEVSPIKNIIEMNDLNLVFLITDKQVFSYSPVTGKTLLNEIANLPANKTASFTYLTYLYLLDAPDNQITQYPRAGAGFGTKKDWLKESADLSQAVDLTADDAIYLLFSDGRIARYFRGKKTNEFFVEKDGEKILAQKIKTSTQSEWLFLLSPEQKTVFQTDKNGKVINQWTSSQLEKAQRMEIDFESKMIFVSTEDQKVLEIRY